MNFKLPEIKPETLLKLAKVGFALGTLVVTSALSSHEQKKYKEEIAEDVLNKISEQQNS